MSAKLPQKILDQMARVGLPLGGSYPFEPRMVKNKKGEPVIDKKAIKKGPKSGKRGYVDTKGRIWIKDRAHANVPDHWDVQLDEGDDYFRVDLDGEFVA